ncbi:dephospho-CoA kinase [Bacillus massiliglaciei]|uniref:dephospho-CoA kinase n=1 Tax=Bacillus massiliglaciei TaxID=1816693 RepID=UPI000AE4B5E3|nr:dephospho-CoA kinase [Bacillus massiliglaciei]
MRQIIGITGGIASGKSSVSNYLKELGFSVIDADIASRKVVEPGEQAYKEIVDAFGKEIVQEDGSLDRPRLGAIVFTDEEKRLLLNRIVHPQVRKWMKEETEAAFEAGAETVFMDIPLLFESKLTYMVEKTILIYADEDIQLSRLMKRNGFTKEEAEARIRSQMPLADKKKLADEVVNNNGEFKETASQIRAILEKWNVL